MNKAFSNDIESEGLFRTSGNSKSLFLRFLALVEVFGDFSPENRIQHEESYKTSYKSLIKEHYKTLIRVL